MSDSTRNEYIGNAPDEHHPRHRLEGVPVDAEPGSAPDEAAAQIDATFGENPDTSLAG